MNLIDNLIRHRALPRVLLPRLAVASAILAVAAISAMAEAATFVVTNTDDTSDASGVTMEVGSLRYAMLAANASGDASNTIVFSAGLSGEITLAAPLPLVLNNLTIDGSGASIVIEGHGFRPFFIGVDSYTQEQIIPSAFSSSPLSKRLTVALRNLTVFRGRAIGGEGATGGMGAGGAIFINSAANVTLDNVVLLESSVIGGSGTGTSPVFNYGHGGGGLGGTASAGGGGIFGGCHLTIINCLGGSGVFGDAGLGGGGFSGDGAAPNQPASAGTQFLAGITGSGGSAYNGDPGGSNGGGGGGDDVDSSGGGGFKGLSAGSPSIGGNAVFGGGGGGVEGGSASRGGDAGFGGGGGAVDESDADSVGGHGGFGGGGGSSNNGEGGSGGFGGGGGSGANLTLGGHGGFGGGGCGTGTAGFGGSNGAFACGGGAGFGGAIFVVEGGNLLVTGNLAISGGAANGGFGTQASAGAAAGKGIFLQGTGTLNFAPSSSDVETISDDIADEIGTMLPAPSGYVPGSWSINLTGPGVLVLAAHESRAGDTVVSSGTLKLTGVTSTRAIVGLAGAITGKGTAGAIVSNGMFAPGSTQPSISPMTVTDSVTLLPDGLTCFFSDASGQSTGAGIYGAATIDGAAHLEFAGSPANYTVLNLISAASLAGTFSSFDTNVPGLQGVFSYSSTAVTFTVTDSDVLFRDGFETLPSPSFCAEAYAR